MNFSGVTGGTKIRLPGLVGETIATLPFALAVRLGRNAGGIIDLSGLSEVAPNDVIAPLAGAELFGAFARQLLLQLFDALQVGAIGLLALGFTALAIKLLITLLG